MIKYAEDISKEIKEKDNISFENCISGEEFEKWLREEYEKGEKIND